MELLLIVFKDGNEEANEELGRRLLKELNEIAWLQNDEFRKQFSG
jgi:hypothetical protein